MPPYQLIREQDTCGRQDGPAHDEMDIRRGDVLGEMERAESRGEQEHGNQQFAAGGHGF